MRKDPEGNELLRRMHYKHGAYWYVYRNQWRQIGTTYRGAVREWVNLTTAGGSMVALLNKTYDAYTLRVKAGELKQSTMKSYNVVRPTLLKAFQNLDPCDVTAVDVRRVLSHYYGLKPNVGNRALVVLRSAFEIGLELGLCASNPAAAVKRKTERKRKRRLTQGEYAAIRSQCRGYLPILMDVLYYTGQRIGDVLAIRQADIVAGKLSVTQQKTGMSIDIEIGPELERAITAARGGPVTGLWLFSRRGKPIAYSTVHSAYQSACKRAGITDTTLHDIRAKAITDLTLAGHDAQALAGHADPKMTERYIREKRAIQVKSLDSVLDNLRLRPKNG